MRFLKTIVIAVCAATSLGACDEGSRPSTAGAPAASASPGASVASTAVATAQVVLTVDAAHDMMTKKDAQPYTIPASASLVIEVGEFRFPVRDAAGAGVPDAVHVAHGSSGYYRGSFSGKRVTLNAASLDPVKGRGAFPGFEAGESYIIALGSEAPSASDGAMRFTPAWSTKVNVTSK